MDRRQDILASVLNNSKNQVSARPAPSFSKTTITLFDIPVPFPFQPYPVQERYMHEVIETLQVAGRHALLESPTGTGKTLCLLSASLAWQQRQGEGRPRIFYASRTHSQLSQVTRELRKTVFPSLGVTAVAVGSRDQLCVQSFAKKMSGKNLLSKCKTEVDAKRCSFYNGLLQSRAGGKSVSAPKTVMDVEEIRAYGNRGHLCPYFMAREVAKHCDVVFLPYNYLFDEDALRSLDVEISGSIVIVDEAHNLEKVCEEVSSVQLDSYDFTMADDELRAALILTDTVADKPGQEQKTVASLKAALTRLAAGIFDFACTAKPEEAVGFRELKSFLEKAKITGENFREFLNAFDTVDKVLTTYGLEDSSLPGDKRPVAVALTRIRKLLVAVFEICRNEAEVFARHFRAFTQPAANRHLVAGKAVKEFALFIWCFSPALAINNLVARHKIRNLLVTSGTLAPLAACEAALGTKFPVQLANAHVIDSKRQLFSGVIALGPSKTALNASFKDRATSSYLDELGQVILSVARRVPEGLLVAFASYAQLDHVLDYMERSFVLRQIPKRVFREPNTSKDSGAGCDVQKLMADYGEACVSGRDGGAVLFCVARGKLSEGVDFSDSQCRGVMMVGIPFANFKDKRVAMKKDFLDLQQPRSGDHWYRIDAMRAVNQTIGRVIRHKHDYGAILLCDERFARMKADLPAWLTSAGPDAVPTYFDFAQLEGDLDNFFQTHNAAASLGLKRQAHALEYERHVDGLLDRAIENRQRASNKMPKVEPLSIGIRQTLAAAGGQLLQCKPHEIGNPLVRRQTTIAKPEEPAVGANNNRDLKSGFYEKARQMLPSTKYEIFKTTLIEFVKLSKQSGPSADLTLHYRKFKEILEPYGGLLSMLLAVFNPSQVAAFEAATGSPTR